MVHACPLLAAVVALVLPLSLIATDARAKGIGGAVSSVSKTATSKSASSAASKAAGKTKSSPRPEINIDLSTRGGQPAPAQGGGAALSAPGVAPGAAAAGKPGTAGGPKDSPEEARKRIDQREAQMKAEKDEKARQRAEDERLAALAAKERERRAAEAEQERLARQRRAQQALGGAGGCVIKPVMTDAEIAACRR